MPSTMSSTIPSSRQSRDSVADSTGSQDERDIVASIRGGYKQYPGVIALENVDFTLRRGEIRALLGKNGAGKSTLIRMLTGSEKPDRGTVMLGGQTLSGSDAQLTRRAAELGVRA